MSELKTKPDLTAWAWKLLGPPATGSAKAEISKPADVKVPDRNTAQQFLTGQLNPPTPIPMDSGSVLEGLVEDLDGLNLPKDHHQALVDRIHTLQALGEDPQVEPQVWLQAVLQFDEGLSLLKALGSLHFREPATNGLAPLEETRPPLVGWVMRRLVLALSTGQQETIAQAREHYLSLRKFVAHLEQKTQWVDLKRSLHHPIVAQGLDRDQLIYFCEVPESSPSDMELLRPEDPCFFDATPRKVLNESAYVQTYMAQLISDPEWARQLRAGEAVLYNRVGSRVLATPGQEAQTLAALPKIMADEMKTIQAARYENFFSLIQRQQGDLPAKTRDRTQEKVMASGQQWLEFQELARAAQQVHGDAQLEAGAKQAALQEIWNQVRKASEDLSGQLAGQEDEIAEHPEWLPFLRALGVQLEELQNPFGKLPDHPDRASGGPFENSEVLTDYYNNQDKVGSVAQSESEYQADPQNQVRPASQYLEGGYFQDNLTTLQVLHDQVLGDELPLADAIAQAATFLLHARRNHFVGTVAEWLQSRQPQAAQQVWFQDLDLSFTNTNPQEVLAELLNTLRPVALSQQTLDLRSAIKGEIKNLETIRDQFLEARKEVFAAEFSTASIEDLIVQYESLLKNEIAQNQVALAYAKFQRLSAGGPSQEAKRNSESLQSFQMWKGLTLDLAILVASFGAGTAIVAGARGAGMLRGVSLFKAGSFSHLVALGGASYGVEQLLTPLKYVGEAPSKTTGEHFRDLVFFIATLGALGKAMAWYGNRSAAPILSAFTQRTGITLVGPEASAYVARYLKNAGALHRSLHHMGLWGTEYVAMSAWTLVEGNLRLALEGQFAPDQVAEQVFSTENLQHQALFILGMKLGNGISRPLLHYSSAKAQRLVLGEKKFAQWQQIEHESRALSDAMGRYLESVWGEPHRADPARRQKFFLKFTELAEARAQFLRELPISLKNPTALEQAYQDLAGAKELVGASQVKLVAEGAKQYSTDPRGLEILKNLGADLHPVTPGLFEMTVGTERVWLQVPEARSANPFALAAQAPRSMKHWWGQKLAGGVLHMDLLAGGGLAYQALAKVLGNFRYRNQLGMQEKNALRGAAFELASREGKLSELGREVTSVDQVDPMRAVFYLQEKVMQFAEFIKTPAGQQLGRRGGPHERLKAMIEHQAQGEAAIPKPTEPAPETFVSPMTKITHVAQSVSPPAEVIDYVLKLLGPERQTRMMAHYEIKNPTAFRQLIEQILVQGATVQRRFADKSGGFRLPVSPEQTGLTPTSLENRNTLLGYYLVFLDSPKARQEALRKYNPQQVREREARRWERAIQSGYRLLQTLSSAHASGSSSSRGNPQTLAAEIHHFRSQIARITLKAYDAESGGAQVEVAAYALSQTGGKPASGMDTAVLQSLMHVRDLKQAYELSPKQKKISTRIAVERSLSDAEKKPLPVDLMKGLSELRLDSSAQDHRRVAKQVVEYLNQQGVQARVQEQAGQDCHIQVEAQGASKHWLSKMARALKGPQGNGPNLIFSTQDYVARLAHANEKNISLPWENLTSPHLTTGGGHEIRHFLRDQAIRKDTGHLLKLIEFQDLLGLPQGPEGLGPLQAQSRLPIRIRLVAGKEDAIEGTSAWGQMVRRQYGQEHGHGVEEVDAYGFEIRSMVQTMRRLHRIKSDPGSSVADQALAESTLAKLGQQVRVLGKIFHELVVWDLPAMERGTVALQEGGGEIQTFRQKGFQENRVLILPDGTRFYFHLEQIDGRQSQLGDYSRDPAAVGREFTRVVNMIKTWKDRVAPLLREAEEMIPQGVEALMPWDQRPPHSIGTAPNRQRAIADFMGDNRRYNRQAAWLVREVEAQLRSEGLEVSRLEIEEVVHRNVGAYKDGSDFRRNGNGTPEQLAAFKGDLVAEFKSLKKKHLEPGYLEVDLNLEAEILLTEFLKESSLPAGAPEKLEIVLRIRQFMEVQIQMYGYPNLAAAAKDQLFWTDLGGDVLKRIPELIRL